MEKRPVLPVISEAIFTDREELLTFLKERALDTRLGRTMSIVLLGHRRVGKTEVLKRLYNWLFWEQDEVVPIYITYETLSRESREYAEEYLNQFCRQYVAFHRKDPDLASSDIKGIVCARQFLAEGENEGLRRLVENYLNAQDDRSPGRMLDSVILGPRRVADRNEEPIFMMVDEFQHVIEIRNADGIDPNVLGKHQPAVESRWCPHLVSGSAVTLLTKEIIGRGSLFGRFRPRYIRGLEGYYAVELCHRLSRYYEVPVTDEMAAELYRRTGGNPFYLDCLFHGAAEAKASLTSFEQVSRMVALELTQGTIWSELYRQLNYYFREINEYGITKNIFYFASRYRDERINPRTIAAKMAHWKVTENDVYKVLLALSRADLLEEKVAGTEFYNVKDPILREFAEAWARVDVENATWETAETELEATYRRLSGEYANFRGYAVELFVRLLLMKFDGRTVEGRYAFSVPGDVVLPKFVWVDARTVKTPSTPEYQIDAIGMVMPEMWVVEVKYTEQPVGLEVVEKIGEAAAVAAQDLHAERVVVWVVSKQGFTRQAVAMMRKKGYYASTVEQVNALLGQFGLRPIPV